MMSSVCAARYALQCKTHLLRVKIQSAFAEWSDPPVL